TAAPDIEAHGEDHSQQHENAAEDHQDSWSRSAPGWRRSSHCILLATFWKPQAYTLWAMLFFLEESISHASFPGKCHLTYRGGTPGKAIHCGTSQPFLP